MISSTAGNSVNPSAPSVKKLWHGVDRSQITWFPIIDEAACTGCDLCVLTCGNSVYQWDATANRPVVAVPQNCVLGCTTCGKLCPENAISFPEDPKVFIKNLVLKYKIFPKVRDELSTRLAKFPDHLVEEKKEN